MTGPRPNNGGKRRNHVPRKLTHEQAREALALIAQGTPDKTLCRRYDCHRATIHRAIKRLGVEIPIRSRKGRNCSLTPEQEQEVLAMLGRGSTKAACARALRVGRGTIYRVLERSK